MAFVARYLIVGRIAELSHVLYTVVKLKIPNFFTDNIK